VFTRMCCAGTRYPFMTCRIRCQASGLCKPPVSPFAGLNNQHKPVLKRHGDGDPVERPAPAFDQIGDRLRDKVERDVRDLFCGERPGNGFSGQRQPPRGWYRQELHSNGLHCSVIRPRFHSAGTHSPALPGAVNGTGRYQTGSMIQHTVRSPTPGQSLFSRRGPRNPLSGR